MSKFNIEVPVNPVSFGQIGYGVLVELFDRGLRPNIFIHGTPDLKSFIIKPGFVEWLQECTGKAETEFSVDYPTISLWHIQGSHKRLSKKNVLWTAHECDRVTETEVNILKNYDKVLTTSNYSKEIFSKVLNNVDWCPNFFDSLHFYNTNRTYRNSNVITFGLYGKLEHRKHTTNIMIAWANTFANNSNYRLNCLIYNPFLPNEVQGNIINSVFQGRMPSNINILPFQESNIEYNEALNNADVDITGLSGAEGWNLPVFHSLCLGKQAVVLNEHAHRDFANSNNSFLVNSTKKIPIYDNQFFKRGANFNQGEMFAWDIQEAQQAMLNAANVAKQVNEEGKKLQQEYTVSRTVDKLLSEI